MAPTSAVTSTCEVLLLNLTELWALAGAASFTIYTNTKESFREHRWLAQNTVWSAASIGGIGGAISGSLISFGSARE